MSDEHYLGEVEGSRKGRGGSPCLLRVGYTEAGSVVLRTLDKGGVSPIVVLLTPSQALDTAAALLQSARTLSSSGDGAPGMRRRDDASHPLIEELGQVLSPSEWFLPVSS